MIAKEKNRENKEGSWHTRDSAKVRTAGLGVKWILWMRKRKVWGPLWSPSPHGHTQSRHFLPSEKPCLASRKPLSFLWTDVTLHLCIPQIHYISGFNLELYFLCTCHITLLRLTATWRQEPRVVYLCRTQTDNSWHLTVAGKIESKRKSGHKLSYGRMASNAVLKTHTDCSRTGDS